MLLNIENLGVGTQCVLMGLTGGLGHSFALFLNTYKHIRFIFINILPLELGFFNRYEVPITFDDIPVRTFVLLKFVF